MRLNNLPEDVTGDMLGGEMATATEFYNKLKLQLWQDMMALVFNAWHALASLMEVL